MSPSQAAGLGAVQGLTEFLPISSSAHLYVMPTLLGWQYAGVAFDVALHWGTLLALVAAFWRFWWTLGRDVLAGPSESRARAVDTLLKLAIASIPATLAGLALERHQDTLLRSLPLQAATLGTFGFLLWWVDRHAPQREASGDRDLPGWRSCLLVGSAQALALVPGVSRSGVTITTARALGLPRVAAARLSFLLATPITVGAGLLELGRLSPDLPTGTLVAGVGTAAVTGFLAIHGLLRWLGHAGFGVFFAYRAALALFLLLIMGRF